MRIAMLGTRGVPARYGGFETCIEEVGKRLTEAGHTVVVYCRDANRDNHDTTYLGMELVHLPALRGKSIETLSHSAISVAHLLANRVDAAIVFNAANSVLLPAIRAARIPVATHVDGLEWKRSKWQGAGRRYYRAAETLAVRWSDALIADAHGIADYYRSEFDADTHYIAYGSPRIAQNADTDEIGKLGLTPSGFHLLVARFEPENNVHLVVDGYRRSSARLPLVVVGSAPYADNYLKQVHALADERVQFLGGVWNQELLNQLYAHSRTYLHGHSVGGTNPSLLRAMGAAAPAVAFNVAFNREVLGEAGRYFLTADEVSWEIEQSEQDPGDARARGLYGRQLAARYDWDDVAERYEALCKTLVSGRARRTYRPSGRRHTHETPEFAPVSK